MEVLGQLTEAELAAVTSEAHRMGFKVSAHAEGLVGCEAAIAAGADTIEHGMYLHRRPDLLEAMAANGQVLVPTLAGYYWMAGLSDTGSGAEAEPSPEMTPMLADLARRNIDEGAASLQGDRQAGVKIALGSDVSLGTGSEIQLMIRHGLTPAEALMAATSTAAQALDLAELIGTVEEGKLAEPRPPGADGHRAPYTPDAVGPEQPTFYELVCFIRDAIGSRSRVVRVPGALIPAAAQVLGRALRDTLLTGDEYRAMADGLADTDGPATGQVAAYHGLNGRRSGGREKDRRVVVQHAARAEAPDRRLRSAGALDPQARPGGSAGVLLDLTCHSG